MHTFKDINGRQWPVVINVNTITRVRAMAGGFDLLAIVNDRDAIASLLEDPVRLVEVLYAVCQPEADKSQITPEAFGEALGNGDVIEQAALELIGELADFFPKHRREPLKKALQKLQQVQIKASELAIKRIESPEMDRQIEQILEERLLRPPEGSGASSGSSPGSAGSTRET